MKLIDNPYQSEVVTLLAHGMDCRNCEETLGGMHTRYYLQCLHKLKKIGVSTLDSVNGKLLNWLFTLSYRRF